MNNAKRSETCLDQDVLTRYLHGQILSPESSAVSLHLEGCEYCVQTCESLPTLADAFELDLKSVRNQHPLSLDSDCERMLERIQDSQVSATDTSVKRAAPDQNDLPGTADESHPAEESSHEILPTTRFGRYTILRRLGAGGMATVYQALDTRLNRQVALKLPHRSIQDDPVARARFQQEGHAAAAVTHPNACGVLDIGEFAGLCFLTMPLLEGESLAERLKRHPPLELDSILKLVCELCLAVDAIHAQGVIHRDIKPGNIFLTTDGRVVLMDFGIALPNQTQDRLTRTHLLMGTPAYFSPEQAAGDWQQVGPAADIYAVGVVLYELLSGHPPFSGTAGVIIGNILHQAAPRLVSAYPECDQSLIAICDQAMAKQIDRRFQTGAELRTALLEWRAARDTRISAPSRQKTIRGRMILAGVLTVGVLLALVFIKIKGRWGQVEITVGSPEEVANSTSPKPESDPPAAEAARPQTAHATEPVHAPLGQVSSTHRQALPELARLPEGVTWLACVGPDQLLPSSGETVAATGIQQAAVNGTGLKLALLHAGPTATIWDVPTLKRTAVIPLPKYDTTLTLSFDGSHLLTAGGGWRVRIWDIPNARELAVMPGHSNWINTLAVDREGTRAASSSKDGTVRCWDLKEKRLLWTQPQGVWSRSVAISQSGDRVASGGNDGFVKFWNAATGEFQRTFKASDRAIVEIRFAKDLLSTLDIDGTLTVWEISDDRPRWSVATRPLHSAQFHSHGDQIACSTLRGSIQLLETRTGQAVLTFPDPTGNRSWMAVGWSSNDLIIRAAEGYVCVLRLPAPTASPQ